MGVSEQRRAPWGAFALWVLLTTAGLSLARSNRALSTIGPDHLRHPDVDFGFMFISVGIGLTYAVVGLMILIRRRHVIGWLLLAIAVGFQGRLTGEQYVLHAVVADPGSLPVPLFVAMTTQWMIFTATTSIVLILLLFPTGRVRSARWGLVVRAALGAAMLYIVAYTLTSDAVRGPWVDHGIRLNNPLAVASLYGVLRVAFSIGVGGSLIAAVAGIACLVLRFRSSRGVERQQIKFLMYVGLVLFVLFVSMQVLPDEIGNYIWTPFFLTLMFGIPLAIGGAILRYKLFEIDRIISRTVSYAMVTALLAGIYAGLVLPFGLVTRYFTRGSNVAVAASTLIVAGAFGPVRRRVQRIVDRRFDRSRYNAERTIEDFSGRLRDEIDIDALGTELRQVLAKTMQPAHASLWVNEKIR